MEYSEIEIAELARTSASRFAVLGQGAALARRYPHEFAAMLNRILRSFVSFMNGKAGDRKRKHIDRLVQVIRDRNASCRVTPAENKEAIKLEFANCCLDIERIPGKGLHVILNTFMIRNVSQDVPYPEYFHLSASEEDITDLLEMFDRFVHLCNDAIVKEETAMRRQCLVSEIEMPTIEPVVMAFMEKNSIRNYDLFIGRHGRIVLEVQIVGEYWMGNDTVGMDNIERVLGIIPYLIKRPDRIKEDGLGFQSFRRW